LGKDQDGAENNIRRDKKIAVKKKFDANRSKQILIKLQMCTKLLCIHGLVFLRAMLKRIQLAKEHFISQIEDGV
jgi:hypothetical protein